MEVISFASSTSGGGDALYFWFIGPVEATMLVARHVALSLSLFPELV